MVFINYPPKEIYDSSTQTKPDYDLVILWMVYNNEVCKWSYFTEEPVQIPIGTLSRHLRVLKNEGYIDKISRGNYKINPKGKKKYYELSRATENIRKVNYPPKLILKNGRNYSDWILWMLYNNPYCKRADFLKEPLSINNSSLMKNLKPLIEEGFIIKEDGKYKITRNGKLEYSRILQNYNLDRQTILEEEGKIVEEINKKIVDFFNKFRITDKEIKFQFINYILNFPYEGVNQVLKDEELFYKILLYLTLNHPNRYPNFISIQDFSKKFKIKKSIINYYVDEFSEGKIYQTKFFNLDGPSGGKYYFPTEGKLEKMLQVLTENQINKLAYLNILDSKKLEKILESIDQSLIDRLLEEACESTFHKDFKKPLKEFFPEYIKYLAYKISLKPNFMNLYDISDKLEWLIWENMSEAFNLQLSKGLSDQFEEKLREIDNQIEFDPKKFDLYESKIKILIYYNQYSEVLKVLDNMLDVFPEEEINIKMKMASILKKKKDIKGGFQIIEELIQKYPINNDLLSYKAYWLQYLDRKEEALEIIQKLIDDNPDKGIYYDNYGEILMYFEEYDKAVKRFLKAIVMCSEEWFIYQSYIKLGICYNALGNDDLSLKNLKKGKELAEKISTDSDNKAKWIAIADLFLSEI